MIKLNYIRLQESAHHVDTTFTFGQAPVMSVVGINKDRLPYSSNGAGKSAIFYALCTILQDHPLAVSKKKLKVGTLTLAFQDDDHEYKIVYTGSYKIFIDDKDIHVRTKALAIDKIREIFPLSPAKFYSTFYINSLLFSPFLNGTDANRLTAFEEIFPLDVYKELQKPMLAKVRELKAMKIRRDTLDSLTVELEKPSPVVKEKRVLATLKTQYEALASEYQQHSRDKANYSRLSKDAQALVPLSSVDYDEALSKYETYAEAVGVYKADNAAYLAYTKQDKDPMPRKARKALYLDLKSQVKTLQAELKSDLSRVDTLIVNRELLDDTTNDLNNLVTDMLDMDTSPKALAKLDTSSAILDHLNHVILSNKEVLSNLSKLDGLTACPTCCSSLAKATVDSMLDNANDSITKAEHKKALIQLKCAYDEATATLAKLEYSDSTQLDSDVSKLNNHIKLNTRKLKSVKVSLQESRTWLELEVIAPVAKPRKPEPLGFSFSNYRDAKGVRLPKPFDVDAYTKLGAEISALTSTIESYTSAKAVYDNELARQESMEAELADIATQLLDLPCYEALAMAYSNTGIKIHTLRALASACTAKLNLYKSLLFAEDFTFDIQVSPSSLQIIVTRPTGLVSDVRLLSGAERRQFICLLYLAIISITPSSGRVDTVILDEIESGMDESSRNLFTTEFLPSLSKFVNVVVVSPHDLGVGKQFCVVREHGEANLKEV